MKHVPRLLALALSLAPLALPASAADAQSAAAIPAPLVAALLAGDRYENAVPDSFYVGSLPAGWPASLTPPGAPIVGGTSRRGALVAVFADTATDALARYHAMITKAGWTRPELPPQPGFQSIRQPHAFFCHDSARVAPSLVSDGRRGTSLYVSLHPSVKGACGATVVGPGASPFDRVLVLPALTPPAGATSNREGTGMSGDDVMAQARIDGSAHTPAQLVEHYGAQLSAAGWTAGTPLSGDDIATQRFTAHDKYGKPWQGMLTVLTNGMSRNVYLAMHTAADK